MQAESLGFVVRERAPWEAVDLGVALTRAHAGLIWGAWLVVTGSALLLLLGLGYAIDQPWVGGMLLWWLKPAFDRVPLYVLSRAVLGDVPSLRETLRAQWTWGWRRLVPWLLWRRLHPGRALLLAMDLLEQPRGAQRRERVRVLGGISGTPQTWLTIAGVHLEFMLMLSLIVLALMFVPFEFLDDSTKAVLDVLSEDPPAWLEAAYYGVYWLAMSLFEPFYVGAGFALYLNRRSQLEAWDIELAFRRLARRLAATATSLWLGLSLLGAPALAQEVEAPAAVPVPTLEERMGEHYLPADARFQPALRKALADPQLAPQDTVTRWQRRRPVDTAARDASLPPWLQTVAGVIGFVIEHALWIALAIGALLLLVHHRRWFDWFLAIRRPAAAAASLRTARLLAAAESLPDDVATAVEALWQAGQPRAALALLYRGAVARLSDRLGTPLPPGATEADCLRLARRLTDEGFVTLFARIVRHWQAAAYAERLPSGDDLHTLLSHWRGQAEARP